MSFDDDIRNRFDQMTPQIDDVDAGAAAAERSSHRRTVLTRAAGAGVAIIALLVGFLTISNLNDDQTEIRTADPTPTVAPDPTPSTVPGAENPADLSTTGIATIDVDYVTRINDEIVDTITWLSVLDPDNETYSRGPDGQRLITEEIDGCTRITIVVGAIRRIVEDHPINQLSRCIPGELAAWSIAGHVVLVSPTDEDAWSITVLAAGGRSAQLTSPGAFQPQQLDVHTDPNGRTQALVLGTGEEMVYIDVDAFLSESVPELAVFGISNETNLLVARFVDGQEQHPYQALVDAWLDDDNVDETATTEPTSTTEPSSFVFAVTNVEEDDTLNVRSGPGIDFDVVFEFGPNSTGIVRTGGDATSPDGAAWFEVFAPTSGTEFDVGWVNSAFLTETPVSDARPCLFNGPQDHYVGIDWTNPDGSADSDAAVISNIETYRFGGCIRTVIEFSDGWSYQDGGANRVVALPTDIVVTRDNPPTIDFGASIRGAEVAEFRFFESPGVSPFSSVFASLGADRQLDGVLYGQNKMWATFDNTNGTMTIDSADIRLPADAEPSLRGWVGNGSYPIIDANGLILQGVASSENQRELTFSGLARPFEATLGVDVRTTSGSPVDVGWIGGVNVGRGSENGVMTSTWTEAWGQFSFTISLPTDVDPTDVVVVFDPSGGAADDPETIDLPLAAYVG